MITLYDILRINGIEPTEVRLVRHSNKEIAILDSFDHDLPKFEAYQSFQKPKKFGNAKYLMVFALHYRTTALFLGLWEVDGFTNHTDFTEETRMELRSHELPDWWFYESMKYHLRKSDLMSDLSKRLIIEWGPAAVAWVQSVDKEIVELRGKHSVGEFLAFNKVNLSYSELTTLAHFPGTNLTWVKALASVNGVYLITDQASGKLYVGSAYGGQGIYGRWCDYAKTGDGGNLDLQGLDPTNFKFSILEIVPPTATAEEVIECEIRWKDRLGTRRFGLNRN